MIRRVVKLVADRLRDRASSAKMLLSVGTIELLRQLEETENSRSWYTYELKNVEIGREILSRSPEEQKAVVLELIDWLTQYEIDQQNIRRTNGSGSVTYPNKGWIVKSAVEDLLRRKLPLSEDELLQLFRWSMVYESNYSRSVPQIIKQTQDFLNREILTPRLKKVLTSYIQVIADGQYNDSDTRQQLARLRKLAGQSSRNPLVPGEAWSDAAIDYLSRLNDSKRTAWIELLNVCVESKGSVPTAKWQKACDLALQEVGRKNFKSALQSWLFLVDRPRTQRIQTWSEWSPDPNLLINDHNADILKGLVWASAKRPDKDVLRALTALAISAYRKVPGVGPRCVRVGNACVWALGESHLSEAIGHLAVLKTRIKAGSVQKVIEKALERAAVRAKLPKDEMEEMAVPTYGLQSVGHLEEKIGDYSAEVLVQGTNDVVLRWFNSAGKAIKSTPSSLKKEFSNDIKELNQTLKDIRQMLSAQRNRIDCLYLDRKEWNYHVWRERYLDHPLVGNIARRLIWKFSKESSSGFSGMWLDGKLVSSDGEELDGLDENTSVQLWHPMDEATDRVLAWRDFLEENLIRQPFKQAHREVYLLTDAERTTNVYSNRYAAHILKQHQFNALCSARNWKNKLRLMVDDEFPPATRFLPKWNLRAEFWIEGIGENYGEDTNETGTYLYLTTDQVRLYEIDAAENAAHASGEGYGVAPVRGSGGATEPIELDQIPAIVFSEIMRDIDLFVGVSSVGNDPNWLDSGTEGDRRNYWYDYSFGELSVSANSRKEILEKIIPMLKIAAKCTFDDKFLIVKGDLRTYKIHLGSGNILMKPNDQYLCIVSRQGMPDSNKVFLPFEGDQRVAVILSKAFLLADDTKITDQTILRQIKTY